MRRTPGAPAGACGRRLSASSAAARVVWQRSGKTAGEAGPKARWQGRGGLCGVCVGIGWAEAGGTGKRHGRCGAGGHRQATEGGNEGGGGAELRSSTARRCSLQMQLRWRWCPRSGSCAVLRHAVQCCAVHGAGSAGAGAGGCGRCLEHLCVAVGSFIVMVQQIGHAARTGGAGADGRQLGEAQQEGQWAS